MTASELLGSVQKWVSGKLLSPQEKYARLLTSFISHEPWCVDSVNYTGNLIEIQGWAIAPEGNPAKTSFSLNGQPFDSTECSLLRDDIAKIFWYWPNAKFSGFTCRATVSRDALFKDGYAMFRFAPKGRSEATSDNQNYYFFDPEADSAPFPEAERRRRVHGGTSESSFRIEGYTTFVKLNKALTKVTSKRYDDFKNILDWGCGCGRMTRYFQSYPGIKVTGVDIDEDNAAWCGRNFGFGKFCVVPLHPPTNLPDAAFDLITGVSIFTHLKEKEQFEWLGELQRIATKGALVLMTTHGETTACRSALPLELVTHWQNNGFADAGNNPDLGRAVSDNDYYKNTLHTHRYLRQHWTKYFEILDIIPGYIGNHQDLVVMRKN